MSSASQAGTQPIELTQQLTVRTLSVEVLEGPDKGAKAEAAEDRLTIGSGRGNDFVLSDGTVSRFHLELVNTPEGVLVRDLGSKNGTWAGRTALERARIPAGSELVVGRSRLIVRDGDSKEVEASPVPELHGILGADPAMRRLMGKVRRAGATDVPVLVTGESGTGKELVARALHAGSSRTDKPFVVVDCGALTPTLITSALFGHERGAFTGAERRHIGAFERAHGGTVFLDEVGELSPELQPQLLGVLERKRFLRVGGTQEIEVDVRVISATNRDLRSEVNKGAFREDLYYRLSVVNLDSPRLCERAKDIVLLAERFYEETGCQRPFLEVFDEETITQMQRHDWPGNVRELKNFVEATVALGEAPAQRPSRPAPGPDETQLALGQELMALRYSQARSTVLERFEHEYLKQLIARTQGNVSAAARLASMDRSYLIKLLERHSLK